MNRTDDRADITLPVTAEVGSEGGSYSEPTQQVATFEGDLKRRGEVAAGGVGADPHPDHGMVRYPTEPPDQPPAADGGRAGNSRWRTGLMGAAAGAALVIGLSRLRSRR